MKRLAACAMALVLVLTLGFTSLSAGTDRSGGIPGTRTTSDTVSRPEIARTAQNAPNDGIWTIFVYLCGSDLESGGSNGSKDLDEMVKATRETPNLRFVALLGGSKKWRKNEYCADGGNERLVISGGKVEHIKTATLNMGDPSTLYSFLDWGLGQYRSQHVALDLWDHGGGSTGGVCCDERYMDEGSRDRLTLQEIDAALEALWKQDAVKFDLIGFDACLMATVEVANILAPYADYMIASQETEPGKGWDYTGLGKGVKAGAKDGAELGKFICDSYLSSVGSYEIATLSVIKLSALDDFLETFNVWCADIYRYICEKDGLDDVMRSTRTLPSFGKESYNLTDLKLLVKGASAWSPKSDQVLSRLNDCVVYMVNGESCMDVGGLSAYFPLSFTPRMSDMNTLKAVSVPQYYFGIIDVCVYGITTLGDMSGYDQIENGTYWWEDAAYWEGDRRRRMLNFDLNYAKKLFSTLPHRENPLIGQDKYAFTFSQEGLKNVDAVYTNVFSPWTGPDGREYLVDYGADFVASGNYYRYNKRYTVKNVFYEYYPVLDTDSGGQVISVQPLTRRYVEGYGYVNFFYTPVLYNDKFKHLIFYQYWEKTEYYDHPIWSGILGEANRIIVVGTVDADDSDIASRIEPIRKGDVIRPSYPLYYADTLEFAAYLYERGESPYVCQQDGEFKIRWSGMLPNGDYKWSYLIKDIYGNSLYTPTVSIELDRANHFLPRMRD